MIVAVSKQVSKTWRPGSNPGRATMEELFDKPGLVITDKVTRTTKVKKYIEKNKVTDYKIMYLTKACTDFKEVERSLKEMESEYLGLGKLKEKPKEDGPRAYTHTYRLNQNTILCAYSQEDLDKLLKWNNAL